MEVNYTIKVVDALGTPIPGIDVTLVPTAPGSAMAGRLTAVTDSAGVAGMSTGQADSYTVHAYRSANAILVDPSGAFAPTSVVDIFDGATVTLATASGAPPTPPPPVPANVPASVVILSEDARSLLAALASGNLPEQDAAKRVALALTLALPR